MATLNDFLFVYFFQLENELNTNWNGLDTIKFHSEEANTDEEVKLFFKAYISANSRIKNDDIKRLIISRNDNHQEINVEELLAFNIANVLLPSELTSEMRNSIAASKRSVYTNPDLYMQITNNDGIDNYISIELKTTKNSQIPGSSVQQVSPFEWVIFVKHTDRGEIDVTCGFYINSITERLPFPDRSPRPCISFDTLKKWNSIHRKLVNDTLEYSINEDEEQNKAKILNNWEQVLCNEWLETIENTPRQSEKWFNNTIRMFSLKLLKKVQNSPEILNGLINRLSKNVKG